MADDYMGERFTPQYSSQQEIRSNPLVGEIRRFIKEPQADLHTLGDLAHTTAAARRVMHALVFAFGNKTANGTHILHGELLNRDRLQVKSDANNIEIERTTPAEIAGELVEKPVYSLLFPIASAIPTHDDAFSSSPIVGIKRFDDGTEEVTRPYKYSDSEELSRTVKMIKTAAIDMLVVLQNNETSSIT